MYGRLGIKQINLKIITIGKKAYSGWTASYWQLLIAVRTDFYLG